MIWRSLAITLACAAGVANAAVTSETYHGASSDLLDLPFTPSDSDLIAGELPSSASGIGTMNGFRTDPPMTPAGDQFPAYTDGLGLLGSGLTGLLADNEPVVDGRIIQTAVYSLDDSRLDEIRVFTGNSSGDARQFSTFVVSLSTDGGASFVPVGPSGGYFQSDPTDTSPAAGTVSTLQRIFDTSGPLGLGVDAVQIDFYASSNNTVNAARDPFDGVNPFTGVDDLAPAANQSPLVWEVDLIAIPEPAAAMLSLIGLTATAARRR
ncbi:hypothetical protein [Botrimarina sp.]|uniref:hypothetical protein n=1 Tax=Botrimarina sp. TaxID=2795802 RepID=UPI0032EB6829